jgi:hypothetical protein
MAEKSSEFSMRMRPEVRQRFRDLGIRPSEYFRDKADQEIMGEDFIDLRINELKKEIEKLKRIKKENSNMIETKDPTEKEWLKDCAKCIEKNPNWFEPRLVSYRTKFNKPYFSRELFMKKLEAVKC